MGHMQQTYSPPSLLFSLLFPSSELSSFLAALEEPELIGADAVCEVSRLKNRANILFNEGSILRTRREKTLRR
jgi:hypothetical protein